MNTILFPIVVSIALLSINQVVNGENIQEAINDVKKFVNLLNNTLNNMSIGDPARNITNIEFNLSYTEVLKFICNDRPDLLNKTEIANCEGLMKWNIQKKLEKEQTELEANKNSEEYADIDFSPFFV